MLMETSGISPSVTLTSDSIEFQNFKIHFKYTRCIDAQAEVPDGSKYVQIVPDGKCLCIDRLRWNDERSQFQTFVCSSDFRAFMFRLSFAHQT